MVNKKEKEDGRKCARVCACVYATHNNNFSFSTATVTTTLSRTLLVEKVLLGREHGAPSPSLSTISGRLSPSLLPSLDYTHSAHCSGGGGALYPPNEPSSQ